MALNVLLLNVFPSDGLLPQCLIQNQEDQVIFDQGFLPLASVSSCKAADASLVRPSYLFPLVLVELHSNYMILLDLAEIDVFKSKILTR